MPCQDVTDLSELALSLIRTNREPLEAEILEFEISTMRRTGVIRLPEFNREILDGVLRELVESGQLEERSPQVFWVIPVAEEVDRQMVLF